MHAKHRPPAVRPLSVFSFPVSGFRSRNGVALVIILAFIVLLTGVVVAFFSRAISERQVSNSSASQTKAEIFAQGATDQIIGDLKQEIAAGSTSSSPAAGVTIYQPKAPATFVPSLVGSPTPAPGGPPNGYENLVKRSVSGSPFYSGANYDPGIIASNRAAGPSLTQSSTLLPSQNGRSVSPKRWNKALLLAKANPANDDTTPVGAVSPTSWPNAPDWILVGRDGTNPTAVTPAPSAANYVVGRYAYNIYDEGGLLDANVAGSPVNTTTAAPISTIAAYKNALAYTDLTQIPGINSMANAADRAKVINAIVGWRNYVSAGPTTGDFPNYSNFGPAVAPSALTPFDLSVLGNSNGFLKTANTALSNGQSDRLFAGRQQLIELLQAIYNTPQASGGVPAFTPALQQQTLQYLATFSRTLNQPSISPDSTRPKVTPIPSGGNDTYQASSADDKINPSFLNIRVTSVFDRTDWDSTGAVIKSVVGEPLVKRFRLNYLAWLTYEGESAISASTSTKNELLKAGISQTTIDRGTAANIQKSFGLRWANKRWEYVHGISGGSGRIMTLAEVAALSGANAREPDFFELLKASISVGSLGKAYKYDAAALPTTPAGYQQQRDNSVDAQIMQIGANIIDQFDFDGYPTRILFSDNSLFGGTPQEYRGIEDLPYLYRIREGKITIRDSIPAQKDLPTIASTTPIDAGLCAVVYQPEIWNPHAWSAPISDTNRRPTSFRIVAISADPNSTTPTPVTVGRLCFVWSGTTYGGATPSTNLGSPGPEWNEANTEINFGIPTGKLYLYREPTPLIKPGIPDGTVQLGPNNVLKSVSSTSYITSGWEASQIKYNSIADNKQYIGVLGGAGPVAWSAIIPKQGINASSPTDPTNGIVEATSAYFPTAIQGITWRIQYQDSSLNWVTYDEKFADLPRASSYNNGSFWTDYNKTFNSYDGGITANNIVGTEAGYVSFDPRTSRFGMGPTGPWGYRGPGWSQFPVRQNVSNVGWASGSATTGAAITGAISQFALATQRPDENAGFSVNSGGLSVGDAGPTAPGWYPSSTSGQIIQPGMFTQNNPAQVASPTNKRQVSTDGQTVPGTLNQYYADADGVIRRAMGGYVPTDATSPAIVIAGKPSGLPMKTATNYATTPPSPNVDTSSRPIMLNRPFRSPADLSLVFTGTPWKNLDVGIPESGANVLLDTFTLNESSDTSGIIAGKVNLNSRQSVVFASILSGTIKDEFTSGTSGVTAPISSSDAKNLSTAWVTRTTSAASDKGPIINLSQLSGKWQSSVALGSSVDGSKSYVGFSDADLSAALAMNTTTGQTEQRLPRLREASIRALSATGQTRVWNLMIDVIAQTGRYSANATNLANFSVESEQRYWVHLAIDRLTGLVIDKQIEVVKE